MSSLDTGALAQFLHTAHWPRFRERQPTFFSIAGIDYKEVPLSNVYGFFFDSEEAHGLGPLFLQVLLQVVEKRAPGQVAGWPALNRPVRVAREFRVDNRQRLDLLLHDGLGHTLQGASYGVLLENKVNHWLANDLDNYWNSVRRPAKKLGVVISPRQEQPTGSWIAVTHRELAQAVQQQVGPLLSRMNARYLPILIQFLEHLTSMSEQHDDFAQAFDFAQQYRKQLAQAQQVLGKLNGPALGKAVAAAFGEEQYQRKGEFSNRVDIVLTRTAPLYYVVFFSAILDVTAQQPSFAITLYDPTGSRDKSWLEYLQGQPQIQKFGATRLSWFNKHFVIGQVYDFTGHSLTDFIEAVRTAVVQDWQPAESLWVHRSEPPVLPDPSVLNS